MILAGLHKSQIGRQNEILVLDYIGQMMVESTRGQMAAKTTKEPNTSGTELDPFVMNKIYAEPAGAFLFQPRSLAEMKDSATIFLDTNVLLLPYHTGKDSLRLIENVYGVLGAASRLLIPARVVQEFMKNAPDRLTDAFKNISEQRNISIKVDKFPLLEELEEYKDLVKVRQELSDKIKEFQKKVGKVADLIKEWHHDDPVRTMYSRVFKADQVIDLESLNEEEFQKDLTYRYANKIPPGYKDAAKSDRGIGDLLIWKTILQVGAKKKCDAIFICGEEKSDWWHRSDNQAIVVRQELIEEYRSNSGGKTFRLLNMASFLKLFGASDAVVDEVKEEQANAAMQAEVQSQNFTVSTESAEEAVRDWIIKHYPGNFSLLTQHADFEVLTLFGSYYFNVRTISSGFNVSRRIREVRMAADDARENGIEFSKYYCILVASEKSAAFFANQRVNKHLPDWFEVITGYITEDGQFRTTVTLE